MSAADYDIVIVGGGMVGASLAIALSSLDLKTAVIEAMPPRSSTQPSYDDRSTALSWGSRCIFETLGLWRALRVGATPIREIHVSDRGQFGATRLHHQQEGVDALGYVVENRTLGQVLWEQLGRGPARLLCPATVEEVIAEGESVRVVARQGDACQTLRARLLVVADGARSATRTALGVGSDVNEYGQCAVIANVTTQKRHNNVAYERFTRSGPVAFLPMSNGRCSVVWTLPPGDAEQVLGMDETAFLAALQDVFGYRLGTLQKCGARHSYPLSLVRAQQLIGARFAIVGNAANGLHPVAGQGFNLGLRDVASLAEVIADAGDDADPGDSRLLRRYVEWRKPDHEGVVSFTDGLVRVFTHDSFPARAARSAGLVALSLLSGPRSMVAKRSMGIDGRLPRLARGVPLR